MENVWLSVQITVGQEIHAYGVHGRTHFPDAQTREAVHIVFAIIFQFSSRESYSLITFAIFSTKGGVDQSSVNKRLVRDHKI